MKVVISQSMYFPWVGLLEQIHLTDIFVHYDDVHFSRGSFVNRVQVSTLTGRKWMTIPLKNFHLGQTIDEIRVNNRKDWRNQHYELLKQAYKEAPYQKEMLTVVESVLAQSTDLLVDVVRSSMLALASYFTLDKQCQFMNSKELGVEGRGSNRVLDIITNVGGNIYITGHGAKNYLNHDLFDYSGIQVQYLQYSCKEYPQLRSPFTPYVTALDLIANCGKEGKKMFVSTTVPWKEFIK